MWGVVQDSEVYKNLFTKDKNRNLDIFLLLFHLVKQKLVKTNGGFEVNCQHLSTKYFVILCLTIT